jgi:hypothetical protein
MKKETLQEAAKNYAENEIKNRGDNNDKLICSIDFINGAKWEAEQDKNKYSEKEVRLMLSEAFKASQEGYAISADNIIEQFKKIK